MKTISIILATLRPKVVTKCIETINKNTSKDIDYEIVVVSPFNIQKQLVGDNIRFIREEKIQGMYKAVELGWQKADGKYVFVMADDQLLHTGCVENLVKQMSEHDDEIYLTGARSSNLWEIEPDQFIYDYYYPCNSCIRKDILEEIGGLYDIYYNGYLGDPDLALRVIKNHGSVMPCYKAWLSNDNVVDEIETVNKDKYLNQDYDKFFKRWHHIHGKGIKKDTSLINVGRKLKNEEIPMELCTRTMFLVKNKKWDSLHKAIEDGDIITNSKYFGSLFAYTLMMSSIIPIFFKERNISMQRNLYRWLLEQIINHKGILHEFNFKEVFSKELNLSSEMLRNLLIAGYLLFVINKYRNFNEPILVLKQYKGKNIYFKNNRYYDDTSALFESFYEIIKSIDMKIETTKPIDYLELNILEHFFKQEIKSDEELIKKIFSAIDYFCNKKINEGREGLCVGRFWDREK